MSTISIEDSGIDSQVKELYEHMRVLQSDRKLNIDNLESMKAVNSDTIRKLRDDSKLLRTKLSNFQRSSNDDEENQDINVIERQVQHLRKQHDDIKSELSLKQKFLDEEKDHVRELETDSRRPNLEDNPTTRNIRKLENKLDKAMIKYNEAQSIRKTYEQICKRLRDERVGFDNQLKALERTCLSKQRDFEELLLLAGDANYSKDVAFRELEVFREDYDRVKRDRDRELRERHQVVQLRKQMLDRMKQRETLRKEMIMRNSGDLTAAGEEKLNKTISTMSGLIHSTSQETIEQRSKIDIYEMAFRKIREATGVSDANEVISKISQQSVTVDSLVAATRSNQVKMEQQIAIWNQLRSRLYELKYCNGKAIVSKRRMMDEKEATLAQSQSRCDRARTKYERLSAVLTSTKSGTLHLQEILDAVRDELGGRRFEVVSDNSIVDVLEECQRMLLNLAKRTTVAREEKERQDNEESGEVDDSSSLEPSSSSSMLSSRPFNVRVDVMTGGIDATGQMRMDDEQDVEFNDAMDTGEDAISRDKVKRMSEQVVMAANRKHKKGKRKLANSDG